MASANTSSPPRPSHSRSTSRIHATLDNSSETISPTSSLFSGPTMNEPTVDLHVSDEEVLDGLPSYGNRTSSAAVIREGMDPNDQRYYTFRKGPRAQLSTRTICTDITNRYKSAVTNIANGQLRMEPGFSLFDAIGAIEVMDSKMDSGYQAPNAPREEFDVLAPLTYEQTLWIIIKLLGNLAAWQQGFLLTQTLLTSYHIDNLLRCDHLSYDRVVFTGPNAETRREHWSVRLLRLVCLSIVKAVSVAIDQIQDSQAPIWEEEDISTQTYGLTLFSDVDAWDIHNAWHHIYPFIHGRPELDSKQKSQLETWLHVTDSLLDFITSPICMIPGCRGDRCLDHGVEMATGRGLVSLGVLEKELQALQILVPVPQAFSANLQQRYASSTPLRGMISLPTSQIIRILKELLLYGRWMATITKQYTQVQGSDFALVCKYLNTSGVDLQLAYPRARMSTPIWKLPKERDWPTRVWDELQYEWLLEDPNRGTTLFAGTGPNNNFSSPGFGDTTQLQQYLVDVAVQDGGYMDYYRAIWSNVSRRRRTLCHVIKSFGHLEQKAIPIDTALNAHNPYLIDKPLQTWAHAKRLDAAIMVIELGFELSVYELYEYPLMYWLLATASYRLYTLQSAQPWYICEKMLRTSHMVTLTFEMARAWYYYYCLLMDLRLVYLPPNQNKVSDKVQENVWKLRTRPFAGIEGFRIPPWDEVKRIYDPKLRPSLQTVLSQRDVPKKPDANQKKKHLLWALELVNEALGSVEAALDQADLLSKISLPRGPELTCILAANHRKSRDLLDSYLKGIHRDVEAGYIDLHEMYEIDTRIFARGQSHPSYLVPSFLQLPVREYLPPSSDDDESDAEQVAV